ncbi:MAG: lysophospholipid acyltransferase family protein [Pararhodobacter sp.]|nr:lysophospholipid acyltransferase family protein [Pararhodobacter sp.]
MTRPASKPDSRHRAHAPRASLRERAENAVLMTMIALSLRLPLARRVAFMGWLAQHLLAPLSGARGRVRANLAHVMPELPEAEIARICRGVTNNIGRTMIEIFSGDDFVQASARMPIEGPGLAALEAAHAEGRPVILVTAHLGNYEAARSALRARGFEIGAFYMPMSNAAFNRHYVAAMARFGEPLFPSGREGLASMLRHLRGGGKLGLVVDHRTEHGEMLDFLGKPARTALSAAEMALRHEALLIPGYSIRQPDGISFRIEIEEPVPHGDPVTMTQALNDSVAARVRAHPEQWFWVHRRWKDDESD